MQSPYISISIQKDNDRGTLLLLENPSVENYAMKDPELLYRYYMVHKSFPKVGEVRCLSLPRAGDRN